MSLFLWVDKAKAVVGQSSGLWLSDSDFVASSSPQREDARGDFQCYLGDLGFPRDWPAVYSQSAALKSLIGKKGCIPSRRAAVAGEPTAKQRAEAADVALHPLQSFANAERASHLRGFTVVRGWAVFERLDRPPGEAFVAERYWWNALPDGTWVDLTPRPKAFASLLLAEAADGAPKGRSVLSAADVQLAARLFELRFPEAATSSAAPSPAAADPPAGSSPSPQLSPPPAAAPASAPASRAAAAAVAPVGREARPREQVAASVLDYSKWSKIEDSDDDDEALRRNAQQQQPVPLYGAKDLAESESELSRQPPLPDFLVGNGGGGGGTNCFVTLCRLLDADASKEKGSDNAHQLAQAFGKSLRCGMLDSKRQLFYRDAIASMPHGSFIVVLGLGSVLPFLEVARRRRDGLIAGGVLLELSGRLAGLAGAVLKANSLSFPVAAVTEGLDKEEPLRRALAKHVSSDAKHIVVITELMAPDLLSSGIVPCSIAAQMAVCRVAPKAEVRHVPQTIELYAAPVEIRSDRLGGFDVRPFNAFRHTSSNAKADFWWWPVRLDNARETTTAVLGPRQVLCGFDFHRAAEISLDEVRRNLKFQIDRRGRCNGVVLWWEARSGGLEYSTCPLLAGGGGGSGSEGSAHRSEWKQAVHYLAGETAVFVGDVLEVLVSITPRFTVRLMQQSPFSVEAPPWVQAPTKAKFSACLPILPYHFLMMTDTHRLEVYAQAIRDAVRQQRTRLKRRVRVLDAGCGIGLLGMTAALEGADVWLCEAVPTMRQMCREVISANAKDIAEKQGLVQLLPPMMSTRIQVGEDVQEKFDIVVSEVMDVWCFGEGIIPTMRHAQQKLLADGGVAIPGRIAIFAQPLELQPWAQIEREHKANLSPIGDLFKSKFSAIRIGQLPHRMLSDEPVAALEIDLRNVPKPPADGTPNLDDAKLCIRMGKKPALHAKVSQVPLSVSGMLCGYGMWWAVDLGNGHMLSSSPSSPQRSWKQIVRWLDEPRFVGEGETAQVLACYNEFSVNLEDLFMGQDVLEQHQEQLIAARAQAGRPPPGSHSQQEPQPTEAKPMRQPAEKKKTKATDAVVAAALGVLGVSAPTSSTAPAAGTSSVQSDLVEPTSSEQQEDSDDAMLEVD